MGSQYRPIRNMSTSRAVMAGRLVRAGSSVPRHLRPWDTSTAECFIQPPHFQSMSAPPSNHNETSHPAPSHRDLACTPTWAQPSNDGSIVYVACNQTSEIVAVDVKSWKLVRRFPAGLGVYNLAMTKNGRLIATNKRGQSVSIFEPLKGKELARIPTLRKVVHGVVVTPDDRYAFISVEGIGAEPGTVEVIDLETFKTVATVDVGEQAAGIDFWKMESGKPPEKAH